jgi:hypothetical protein
MGDSDYLVFTFGSNKAGGQGGGFKLVGSATANFIATGALLSNQAGVSHGKTLPELEVLVFNFQYLTTYSKRVFLIAGSAELLATAVSDHCGPSYDSDEIRRVQVEKLVLNI